MKALLQFEKLLISSGILPLGDLYLGMFEG